MKSSTGVHYVTLDHVRGLAAFLVFTWHFTHGLDGYPVSFHYVPAFFPMALLDEGHTGVALFMTLSGYLFAKLCSGKDVKYLPFLWNRILRLFPLLGAAVIVVGIGKYIHGEDIYQYGRSIAAGLVFPTLPNGGWSVTCELHFYLILPLMLIMIRKSSLLPFSIVAAAIGLRILIYHQMGEVQSAAYWTIIGRIDQFAFGMIMYQFRGLFANRHGLAVATLTAFGLYYWYFALCGGFFNNPSYPSPSPIWIIMPTVEGAAYAIGIAWYDNSFRPSNTGFSGFLGRIGEVSYSIYILHFFVIFHAGRFVNDRIMDISNFYLACAWSVLGFLLILPFARLSFRFVESPFLKLRRRYIEAPQDGPPTVEIADAPPKLMRANP